MTHFITIQCRRCGYIWSVPDYAAAGCPRCKNGKR